MKEKNNTFKKSLKVGMAALAGVATLSGCTEANTMNLSEKNTIQNEVEKQENQIMEKLMTANTLEDIFSVIHSKEYENYLKTNNNIIDITLAYKEEDNIWNSEINTKLSNLMRHFLEQNLENANSKEELIAVANQYKECILLQDETRFGNLYGLSNSNLENRIMDKLIETEVVQLPETKGIERDTINSLILKSGYIHNGQKHGGDITTLAITEVTKNKEKDYFLFDGDEVLGIANIKEKSTSRKNSDQFSEIEFNGDFTEEKYNQIKAKAKSILEKQGENIIEGDYAETPSLTRNKIKTHIEYEQYLNNYEPDL